MTKAILIKLVQYLSLIDNFLIAEPRPESPLARSESPLAARQIPESPSSRTYRAIPGQTKQITFVSPPIQQQQPKMADQAMVTPVNAAVLFDDFNSFLSKLPLKTLGCFLALIYGMSMFFMITELPPIWLVVVVSAASFIMFRVLGV